MDLTYSPEDEAFRAEVRTWLNDNLVGDFAKIKGMGGTGREHEAHDERLAWNQHMAKHGWTCLSWPKQYGGRELSLFQQVIWYEEYARANAPAGVNHLGETLLGPTLIALGTEEQKQRFLPGIVNVTELWCQGYSEPGAGSDLAGVRTKARLEGEEWVVDGQKVWTSLAQHAQWCFVVARTEAGSRRHAGLSYLLVPMDQPGVEIRPIEQLTATSEFNEVFFDGARTSADLVVGEPGKGWGVAMATLGFERGVSTVGQQIGYARELDGIIATAKANGTWDDAVIRDRIATAKVGLEAMRSHALRTLSAYDSQAAGQEAAASASKLLWANWHRDLGELAMAVQGGAALTVGADYALDEEQTVFLFSRADTLYGGSNEIQKNIIAERVLGLPKEPRPA